ncbi:hypothetical protein Bca4012_076989 [Brassica carinata]
MDPYPLSCVIRVGSAQFLLQVITREDENGNVKLECPAICKQQFAAGRFHIDSRMTATKDADRIARLDNAEDMRFYGGDRRFGRGKGGATSRSNGGSNTILNPFFSHSIQSQLRRRCRRSGM